MDGANGTTCSKTKELTVDFRSTKPSLTPASIEWDDVQVAHSYKYLGVHLDNRLQWDGTQRPSTKRDKSQLYFLWRLRGFNICNRILQIRDASKLNKLVRPDQ